SETTTEPSVTVGLTPTKLHGTAEDDADPDVPGKSAAAQVAVAVLVPEEVAVVPAGSEQLYGKSTVAPAGMGRDASVTEQVAPVRTSDTVAGIVTLFGLCTEIVPLTTKSESTGPLGVTVTWYSNDVATPGRAVLLGSIATFS